MTNSSDALYNEMGNENTHIYIFRIDPLNRTEENAMTNEIKKRYDAFWAHENTDRAVLYMATGREWETLPAKDLHEQWECPEYRVRCAEHTLKVTEYFAEGYPRTRAHVGPGSLAAMTGGDYLLKRNTVWFTEDPALRDDWRNYEKIVLRTDSPMYILTERIMRALSENNRGRYWTDPSGLCHGLDVLSSLRGAQNLLTDLYDHPAEVKRALSTLDEIWEQVFTWQCDIIFGGGQEGLTSWLPVWCRGRWDALQCDFSAMISPDHFEEFMLPSMVTYTEFLDHSLYHLDGPGQIPHLDLLLSLPRLDGIQWMPGDGTPGEADDLWFPIYERIQAAGKNLMLFCDRKGALKLLRHLSPVGLCLCLNASGAEEADEVIARAEECAKMKKG